MHRVVIDRTPCQIYLGMGRSSLNPTPTPVSIIRLHNIERTDGVVPVCKQVDTAGLTTTSSTIFADELGSKDLGIDH